ncbi:hypothetical protein WG907_04575 [Sphingobium sp. AN558]|uniref:hypothetical protein n=1 Tax=Sphingobium sp. AN558 TaxID=3133442 RepID=UPI0030C35AC9
MMYQSSKGAVEISTMPFPYASNALKKLRREAPERTDEINALADHVAALEADEAENPRAVIGGNMPPEEMPAAVTPATWTAIKAHMDDLLDLARGVTGITIEDEAQAIQVGKIMRDLQDAANLADAARTTEKAPLDEAVKEIQDRYNAYIAPLKNKAPGLVSKAVLALNNQSAAWLRKLDDERVERERLAKAAADKAAEEALAAHQAAKGSDDLDEIDAAENLLAAAEQANRDLRQIEKSKTQVKGDYRAISLRSVWRAERIEGEGGKALSHYAKTQSTRVIAFLEQLASEDVKAGIRSIPGFKIIEDRVAA